MAAKKLGDVAIKVGEYEKDGQKKGEYENIGAFMEAEDGSEFLLLNNSCLNTSLAMIANRDRKRRVLVSIFRDRDDAPARTGDAAKPKDDDGIPF